MAKPLEMLLEREFDLAYYGGGGFTIGSMRNVESRILDWHHGRLLKQLRDEEERLKESLKGK